LADKPSFAKASIWDEEVEQLDAADNFLKLENYDLSKINEIQRKIES